MSNLVQIIVAHPLPTRIKFNFLIFCEFSLRSQLEKNFAQKIATNLPLYVGAPDSRMAFLK